MRQVHNCIINNEIIKILIGVLTALKKYNFSSSITSIFFTTLY